MRVSAWYFRLPIRDRLRLIVMLSVGVALACTIKSEDGPEVSAVTMVWLWASSKIN